MLELNAIRLSLKKSGLLVEWKNELQVISENLVDYGSSAKDYDAIVTVLYADRLIRFAIEYERTAKSSARYQEIRRTIQGESTIPIVIYLSANQQILYLLMQELRQLRERVAFGLSSLFRIQQLTAPLVVVGEVPMVRKLGEILDDLPGWKRYLTNPLEVSDGPTGTVWP